jgi:hypothetical protein
MGGTIGRREGLGMTTVRNFVDGSERLEPMPNQKAPIYCGRTGATA